MKKLFFTLFFVFFGLLIQAQSISVKSFQALPTDMTASSIEGKRIDQNGQVAALIKVVTNETGFVFEGGTLGIVGTQQRVSEIWVWVPRGLRKISIMHPQLGQLRDYRFPIEIEAERTYEMVLTTDKLEVVVKKTTREQFLVFEITPPNALLEVDDQPWLVSEEGTARKLVNFGTYSYRVQAPNYITDAGKVTVNDPNNTQIVKITLQPNFGWIEVPGQDALKGAMVYVGDDNELIGKAPCKSGDLKSGNYRVKIIRELYEPYITTVTVRANETTVVNPVLTADFATITLKVDADASIWVNNERRGIRSWTGPLASGKHKIECQLDNHETSITYLDVTNHMEGEVIQLEKPVPISGSLVVESTPDMAELYIDGQLMGETPKLINEILIGRHEIRVAKKGYLDYEETVTIVKDERKQVKATLSTFDKTEFNRFMGLAETALNNENYDQAIEYYQYAYGIYNDETIPGKIADVQTIRNNKIKVDKAISKTKSILLPENGHKNFGGFHIGVGAVVTHVDLETLGGFRADLYYANYKLFPMYFSADFVVVDEYPSVNFGLGSSLTFVEKLGFNYGLGYRVGDDLHCLNYNLGLTWMFDNAGWGGISYGFERPFDATNYNTIHKFTYIMGKKPSVYVGAGVVLLVLIAIGASLY